MAGSIFIPLISVFDGKGVRDAKTSMAALAGVVKKARVAALAAAAAFAAVKATEFVKESVVAARDLDRNMVGLGNVFEGLTPQMQQFAKDASAIGLSQVEASRASTFLGSVLKQSGFEMTVVATETKNLVGLASDLAATYGYDVSEALTGMTALFRGEYDPIEKFGVAMKQSEVNALLAARGQKGLTGATLRQAQAQARLDILYQRSQDAQGSYAQQSGTLFTAQKNLTASFENLKAALGASLTGPLATILTVIQPLIDVMQTTGVPIFNLFGKVVEMLAPLVQPLIDVFLVLTEAFTPILDLLFQLIEPLLVPLAKIFELISNIIKPFIPLITFLAKVFGAILTPVIMIVSGALTLLIEGLSFLFKLLGKIPFFGDIFDDMNEGLDEFRTIMDESKGSTKGLTSSVGDMTKQLSKDIPSNNIDNIGKAADGAKKKVDETNKALNDLLQNAQGIQSSIISSFDVNNVFDTVTGEIVKSVVYIDGKFKAVVSGVKSNSTDIASAFKGNLTKIKTFYDNLKLLIKANLDPTLLAQIASAGPDAGNATAEAIIASGKDGITSLNKTSAGIQKVAGDIGAIVATAMSKSNNEIGNGLIDGLMSQQARFNAAATSLGTSAGKEIAKAVKQTAQEELAAGKITFGQYVEKISNAKKLPGEKKKVSPKYSNMSEIWKPTGPLAPTFKPGQMYGLNPISIKNPYNKSTQIYEFANFQQAKNKAVHYNLNVTVPYGATDAEIGRTLIKQIQAFERNTGQSWRGPRG